jgi:hypothetical protein
MGWRYNRRRFLKNSTLGALAISALSGEASGRGAREYDLTLRELEEGFLRPPDSAHPWVYWFVSDGNITREGITADLEAMHRAGIRGVLYMEVDQYVPKGPVRFLSPQWREMIQHALKEATRLGITVNMNNDGGWTGSGGPWITPELSMQIVVWSEVHLHGPADFHSKLPQPKTILNYYRDIGVLAFPTPPQESMRMVDRSPRLTWGAERKSFDAAKLMDGNPGTVVMLPPPEAGQPQYLNIEFSKPFAARALTVALDPWGSTIEAGLEASNDGRTFHPVRSFRLRWPVSSVNFQEVTARYYRLVFKPGGTSFKAGIPLGEVDLHSSYRIPDLPGKAAYIRQDQYTDREDEFSGEPEPSSTSVVDRSRILDITSGLDGEGRLHWEVPAGKWTVVRFGFTSTGVMNHPAPKEGLGLECDKLSKRAIEVQFAGLMGKLLEDQAAAGARALKMTHSDSWEVGSQNWTPQFREEFQKRRGYDLLPYLPTLTGRFVDSREVSERFLWDLRRTVGDLLLDNYAGHLREISHRHGLTLSIEAYGGGPLEEVTYGGRADIPMSEFWSGPRWHVLWNKEMSSAAHVYGRPICAAESFTAYPEYGKWQNYPFQMKPLGDLAFTEGVNRFVFHRYAMQPWLDRKPGMTMGPWGINCERTNTWWDQSNAWFTYVARCQYLLQTGQFVADVAYLGTENVPSSFPPRDSLEPAIPPGYDFDYVPPEVLLQDTVVQNGRIMLPSGMHYSLLVLPPGDVMTPRLLAKIRDLVISGATVVGPPPAHAPGLTEFPQCDREVRRMAAELWGVCDGVHIVENRLGKGKMIWGKRLAEVLGSLGLAPDFACYGFDVGKQIRYLHRRMNEVEIYFVASACSERQRFRCSFRTVGKQPELWWPDTGRIESAVIYDHDQRTTTLPLNLDPYGSVFVVFRSKTRPLSSRVISVRRDGRENSGISFTPFPELQLNQEPVSVQFEAGSQIGYQLEVDRAGTYRLETAAGRIYEARVPAIPEPIVVVGPWELEFPKGSGAPDRVILKRLISWTSHADPGVRYFSGTATYHARFDLPAHFLSPDLRLYLDLGQVSVMARLRVNGHSLGILWKPPFRVDITHAAAAGVNHLDIEVVNLWPNRLIGDDHLPEDCEWKKPTGNWSPHLGEVLRRWPSWLLEDKPSPTGRLTFTTWKLWTKNDPLLESGLLGPVQIFLRRRIHL